MLPRNGLSHVTCELLPKLPHSTKIFHPSQPLPRMGSTSRPQMLEISPSSLTSLPSRVSYLKSFLSFTSEDGAALRASAPLVAPLVPAILDAVYTKLLSFDITAKAFVPRQPGYRGTVPTSALDLTLDHPQIAHRKDFLKAYLVKLVSNEDWSDDSKFWLYLDTVGVMHTGVPGFKHREKRPELRVEYIHMGLLLGYVEDVVVKSVLATDGVDADTKGKVASAFNKLLWIQNDLFARHYVVDKDSGTQPQGMTTTKVCQSSDSYHRSCFPSQSPPIVTTSGRDGLVKMSAIATTRWYRYRSLGRACQMSTRHPVQVDR